MALKKSQHTTEIEENDVGPQRKRHAVGELFEKLDFVNATVGSGNLTSHLNDFTRLDGIDPAGAKPARRENARPFADFDNDGAVANCIASLLISCQGHTLRICSCGHVYMRDDMDGAAHRGSCSGFP